MAGKKRMTQLQRLRKNMNRVIREATKRGYYWQPEEVIKARKASLKTLKRLQANKWQKLYAKAEYASPETGELVSGTTGRTLERRAAARKAAMTRKGKTPIPEYISRETSTISLDIGQMRLARLREKINNIPTTVIIKGRLFSVEGASRADIQNASNALSSMIDAAIAERGEEAVMAVLDDEMAATMINEIVDFFMKYGLSGDRGISGVGRRMVELHGLLFGRAMSAGEAEAISAAQMGIETYYG